MAGVVDWSGLPPELLAGISGHIMSAFDYMSFRCVCTSWRSAAPKRIFNPLLASCTLLRDDDDGNSSTSTTTLDFFSFRDAAGLVQIDHNLLSDLPPNRLCCGSSHGWLILIDQVPHGEASLLTLFNPFTKSLIDLPPFFPSLPQYQQSPTNLRFLRRQHIHTKVVLSADPSEDPHFSLVVIYANSLVFWRSLQGSWREVELPETVIPCEDALFYEGQLVLTSNGVIITYNLEDGNLSQPLKTDETECACHFLVESAGDLLLVHCVEGFGLYSCEVLKVLLGEVLQVVKVEHLDDRALFLGQNLGISVPANRYPGCKANCIYLAAQCSPMPMIVRVCLEDGSFECIYGIESQELSSMTIVSYLWLKT